MPDYLKDAALLACFALAVVLWSLYGAASAGGYREDPEPDYPKQTGMGWLARGR